jgi:phosphoserine phosphatase RsbU/P
MEAFKKCKLIQNSKDIYQLNKLIYLNLGALAVGIYAYYLYYLNQDYIIRSLYEMVNVSTMGVMLNIACMFSYLSLFALSVIAFSDRKTKKMCAISGVLFATAMIGILHHLYILSVTKFDIFSGLNIPSVFIIMERVMLYTAIYVLLFSKEDRKVCVEKRCILKYIIPVLIIAAVIAAGVFVKGESINLMQGTESKIIELLIEQTLTIIPLIYIMVYSIGRRPVAIGKDMLTDITCALILLIMSQFSIVNSGIDRQIDYLVFDTFRLIGLIVLIRAFYREFIFNVKNAINREESQLKLYVEKLNKVVERNTQEIREKNEIIMSELEYARVIQQSLLPNDIGGIPGKCVFETGYFPCERLSGDFYDIFQVDDENFAMYIFDVSGHGIPAALLTMVSNNFVSASKRSDKKRSRALNPSGTVQYLYEQFNKLNFPDEMHLVIFYGVYNVRTRMFSYSSGGLNCFPIVIKEDGKYDFLNMGNGFPICKLGDIFVPTYETSSIELDEGDTILFYTDGLVDYEKNRLFTQETLIEFLVERRDMPLFEVNDAIKALISPNAHEFNDDVTYFMMRV